ncbi:Hypothetical predicted protein [Pelobates cultripes]|uniref:Uncharacterized protein n=1 Tax=Pelobates cultripes TaxID=61616 RepID=A0AAD1WRV5_PELCU|nr:Hypothetical predicted protein [Pelobates cultripes]
MEAFNENIIAKFELDYLYIQLPKLAIFYHLPRIHKNLDNPPGRPIISGIGSLTSDLSECVDFYLQKYESQAPSYIRDSALRHITAAPNLCIS